MSTEKKEKKAATKVASKIGKQVTYNPNGQDYSTRPRFAPVPGVIVNVFEHNGREVANIVITHDAENGTARKQRVPHKSVALDGECFYE